MRASSTGGLGGVPPPLHRMGVLRPAHFNLINYYSRSPAYSPYRDSVKTDPAGAVCAPPGPSGVLRKVGSVHSASSPLQETWLFV